MTTVYPVAELGVNPVESVVSEDTGAPAEDNTPTQNFLPTVAAIENSLEAFTVKPETHTFVPFIPNVIPEATSAVADEAPSLAAAAEEESAEGTAEEPADITSSDTSLETITEQEDEAEPEVEEPASAEHDDGGEAEAEQVTDGKTTSG